MTGNMEILGRPEIPGISGIPGDIKILETLGIHETGMTEVAETGTRKIMRRDTEKGVGVR
jgi:hypothetical protein